MLPERDTSSPLRHTAGEAEPSGPASCVLLTVEGHHGDAALAFAARLFRLRGVVRFDEGARSAPDVRALADGDVDYLFSFLNPIVLPQSVLGAARVAAVNFHPAPPRWPGVGCVSYALYHGDADFGVTAHVMTNTVDAGPIIRVLQFPIIEGEDNLSLSRRAVDYALVLYYEVLTVIASTGELPSSTQRWDGPARTWNEFRRWMTLSAHDSVEEIRRKVRAVAHPDWPGPMLEVGGFTFVYTPRHDRMPRP